MSTDINRKPRRNDMTVRVLTERNAKLSHELTLAKIEIAALRSKIAQQASAVGRLADIARDRAERDRLNDWEQMGR